MGQFVDQGERRLLDEALAALSIQATTAAIDRVLDYATELVSWGRRVNLTGASTVADLIRGPLFDGLTLLPALGDEGTLVDVGSGGGLPGIPAALLAPCWQVTLVEPRARRCAFLRHAIHALKLDAEVVQSRAEELKDGQWTAAVAQAVWRPEPWLERARRLVVPGGSVLVLSTAPVESGWLEGPEVVEKQIEIVRPFDGAVRFATRVGRAAG